jgi:hypothetical protein
MLDMCSEVEKLFSESINCDMHAAGRDRQHVYINLNFHDKWGCACASLHNPSNAVLNCWCSIKELLAGCLM